ncbi:MAG: polynucleotide adenylyltransferase PcnB, partial [Spirochaetaceae bacterium]
MTLLIRYKTEKNGKPKAYAKVYTLNEHKISPDMVDFDAVKIARRLQRHGYQAYIVGGAVRDLLLGRNPKDFDMATDASPSQIRKLFRNSRIIGKRFRLVHIFFQEKIIEVTTFRSLESAGFNAVYGNIEEDAMRRDFSLNSLYYDPEQRQVIDYTGGYEDIHAGVVRPIIPLKRIFQEDPVRMIRAIKYTVQTGFNMTFSLRRRLKRSTRLLAATPDSRMTEEVFKILMSGNAAPV